MRIITLTACAFMVSSAALAQATAQDPNSMAKPELQRIQDALVKAGYDTGGTDGVWSPQSAAALNQFEANRSLPSTNGKIDHSVLSALGLNKPQ